MFLFLKKVCIVILKLHLRRLCDIFEQFVQQELNFLGTI